MVRSLGLKLVLAFLLISVAGAALTALFARWATFHEFEQLVLEQAQTDFVARATAYYQINGSWQGIREAFHPGLPLAQGPPPAGQPPLVGQPERRGEQVPYVFALVDVAGEVVLPAGSYRYGEQVVVSELDAGVPVEMDGAVVGTALVTGESPTLAAQEVRYLTRTHRASLYAALAAIAIALVLGVVLARTLTRPVRELTAATRALTQGDLVQHVPVRSQDELGELAAAFNQMSADLVRATQLRQQMTADIAHDLRTPLTVMAGYLEALRDGVLQPSPERFETMYHEAQYLQRLIEDLRTLSLADAGELDLNCEPVPPQVILDRALMAYQHQALQHGIALVQEVAPDLPDLSVDLDRVAQVLGNLISNALRYTPRGGQIALLARQRGGQVLLDVRDTGAGISPEALAHIFDRFYRADESRQGSSGESGLGLAIAKSLVELHGGTLSVASVQGRGTMFTLALPVAPS